MDGVRKGPRLAQVTNSLRGTLQEASTGVSRVLGVGTNRGLSSAVSASQTEPRMADQMVELRIAPCHWRWVAADFGLDELAARSRASRPPQPGNPDRSWSSPVAISAMQDVGDLGFGALRPQNATLSPPLSPSLSRASSGVATSRPSASTIVRIFSTCWAFETASSPLPM